MKSVAFILTALIAMVACAQQTGQPIVSKVYSLQSIPAEKKAASERRQILEGSGAVLDYLEIHTTTIEPGKAAHASHHHPEEEMIIVKEGQLKVTINGQSRILGPGSVALAIPGDEHGFENTGDTKAAYYVLRYRSKAPADSARASQAGSSLMIDWNDIVFKPHDKGGRRDFFERPTAMIRRFEMHVSNLNPGLKSHDPHTHKAEEIVLMIQGNAEMQIGDTFQKAAPGDLIYLGSNVLHAIRNDDTQPCIYFAFQWD